MIQSFVTVHRSQEHYAFINGRKTEVMSTEVGLVTGPLKGINLKEYEGVSDKGGNEKFNVIRWVRRETC